MVSTSVRSAAFPTSVINRFFKLGLLADRRADFVLIRRWRWSYPVLGTIFLGVAGADWKRRDGRHGR